MKNDTQPTFDPDADALHHTAMLLIFAIVFLLKRYGTLAVPLPEPPPGTSPPFSAFDPPVFARDDSTLPCSGHRTVLDILWSCLATTFACTWVSVHPNVPWKGEDKRTILGQRINLMFFSILAPEFMVMWAFKQWRGARMIREAVNKAIKGAYPDQETRKSKLWTTAHGHLLQMGGFRLCATARENFYWGSSIAIGRRGQTPNEVEEQHHLHTYISDIRRQCEFINAYKFTVSNEYYSAHLASLANVISETDFYKREAPNELGITQYYEEVEMDSDELIWEGALRIAAVKKLLGEGLIRLPTISEDEISDRSKGDPLSKGLALLQLTWFIVQIITRAARGLAISELELTTAALAGMNSVMYFFWWSKPRDVRFPVVVHTKGVERLLAERPVDDVKWRFPDGEFDFRNHLWASVQETTGTTWSYIVSFPSRITFTFLKLLRWIKAVFRCNKAVPAEYTKSYRRKGTAVISEPEISVYGPDVQEYRQHFAHKWKRVAMSASEYAAFPFYLLLYLVDLAFYVPTSHILGHGGSLSGSVNSTLVAESRCETFGMIFYSEDAHIIPMLATSSIAGALFGAVHCIAWHFSFPSHAEQIMWRSATLGVVGSCVPILTGVIIWRISMNYWVIRHSLLRSMLNIFGMASIVYSIARISVLVLAVTSLRSLPHSTLDTIDWVELFPHI